MRPDTSGMSAWSAWADPHRAHLEPALLAVVASAGDRLRAIDDDLAPIGRELVDYVAAGGKRLRPLLVLLGHELTDAGGEVLGAAIALELVHTWALVHDDVIDADETRRGRPTTHRAFAARHRDRDWSGDATRYGDAVAILVGDLVAVLADEAFERTDAPGGRLVAGRQAFADLRLEVMAGQVLDVHLAAVATSDLERSLRVARLKSGRYTFTRPLQLGARLGTDDTGLVASLGTIGDALGVAFQLRDDLLGVLGAPADTGKAHGGDLREGKRTVLVAEAMQRLDTPRAQRLDHALGTPDLDDGAIATIVDDLESCGAVAAVEARIARLVAVATEELSALPTGSGRSGLAGLAQELTTGWRDQPPGDGDPVTARQPMDGS